MTTEVAMRYGCNPHQRQARCHLPGGELPLEVLNDAPSYINLMDALNSWQLVSELRQATGLPAAASFKHVSPAGAAVGIPLPETLRRALFAPPCDRLTPLACAYARARGADRLASYGDWIALSGPVDVATAKLIRVEVSDGIIAPDYDPEALAILRGKRGGSYKVLRIDPEYRPGPVETRQLFGLSMEQRRNDFVPGKDFLSNVVTRRRDFGESAVRDLIVATVAVKYTQSNSVCLARDGQVVGVGAGQQSRIHCVRLAAGKADNWYLRQHPRVLALEFRRGIRRPDRDNAVDLYLQDELAQGTISAAERRSWERNFRRVPQPLSAEEKREWLAGLKGVALSSDAYFPFRDNIDRASRSGVEFIVQTGGSAMDQEVTAAADVYGMVMVHTGIRLFHH
jgi:AICAR transformylase/IMP cyclohydrolase PurH